MAQTKELEKVKARIRALAEKTISNGCSEAEAMSAAAKVGELLATYSLSMDEVMVREEPCVLVSVPMEAKRRGAMDYVFSAIAAFCDCKVWTGKVWTAQGAGRTVNYFGLDGDVQMARYLHTLIDRAVETENRTFQKSDAFVAASLSTALSHRAKRPGRTVAHAFRMGMAQRVAARLRQMKHEREAQLEQALTAGSRSTALVVVKEQVIDAEMRRQLPHLKLRTVSFRPTINSSVAYREGQKAGERVALDRPLEGAATGLLR